MRTPAALIVSSILLAVMPSAVAAPPPLPVVDGVPVLGQAWFGNVTDDRLAVLSIHGLRRVEGGTVLYYSMGLREQDQQGEASAFFSTYGNGNNYVLNQGGQTALVCTAAAIDVASGLAWSALREDSSRRCISSSNLDFAADSDSLGRAPVAYTVLAPIPETISTVDVLVGSQLVQSIPVEDGLLEPAADEDGDNGTSPTVGTGWPVVDTAAIAGAVDPEGAVFPLRSQVKDVAKKVTTAQRDSGAELDLDTSVLFATDQATLTPEAATVIAEAARQIAAAATTGKVTVTGHTDGTASAAYNLDLSKRRAAAVAAALRAAVPAGIALTAVGKGETEPIADNAREAGRALNRRVTITLPQ